MDGPEITGRISQVFGTLSIHGNNNVVTQGVHIDSHRMAYRTVMLAATNQMSRT